MENRLQAAYLLHSRPYKENQLLLDFITEQQGKVSAITFTGHSVKSNKRPLLQPFLPLNISVKGKSALKKLDLLEPAGKSFHFKGNTLYSGFYLNELLIRLLNEELPCPDLFHQYQQSLIALNQTGESSIEKVLRQFEMILLDELGLTIDFSVLDDYQAPYFYYLTQQGFVPAINKLSQPCYDKAHLLAIAEQRLSDKSVLYTYKLLMRQIITPLLGNKPLNSRKLFTQR